MSEFVSTLELVGLKILFRALFVLVGLNVVCTDEI